jgi:tetratricopeptide (TPR) repeat protein
MNESVKPAPWMRDALKQGYIELTRGNLRAAADYCRRVLGAKPDLVEGHFLVGLIAVEAQDTLTAVRAFGSVTELDKTHGAAWANLARLYARMGHVRRADRALENAIQYQDENPVILDLIGMVCGLIGDHEQASQWAERAVARAPENVPFLVNLANNQMFLGDFDASEKTLNKALSVSPDNAYAHWTLSSIRKATDRGHIETLSRIIAKGKHRHRELAHLSYALGKELEDIEAWDEAFEAFATGANARRKTLHFDEPAEVEMFAALEAVFTAEWLNAQGAGNPSAAPIFIVGQPRTGTTLAERVITSHSSVHSAGELQQFGRCLRRLVNYEGPGGNSAELVHAAEKVDVERLGSAYMMTTEKLQGSEPRFVDKLPTNYRHVPLILAALPNAKIIHIVRNPMDACFASFKQLFADAYPHSYEQKEMARHHARYRHLMQLWRERFPGRFLDLAYEDLASDIEPNARKLIDFLDLPWEDACLSFHKQRAAVTTASAVQVREAAHTRSIGRWRRYEKQLQPMRLELRGCGLDIE